MVTNELLSAYWRLGHFYLSRRCGSGLPSGEKKENGSGPESRGTEAAISRTTSVWCWLLWDWGNEIILETAALQSEAPARIRLLPPPEKKPDPQHRLVWDLRAWIP